MRLLLRLAENIDRLNETSAHIVRWALLANALLIAGNAFSRKLFSVAWANAFDMQWHFFAAVVLLMAAYTFKRDELVRIDIFAHCLGELGLAWLDLFGIVLVLLTVVNLTTIGRALNTSSSLESLGTRKSLKSTSACINSNSC